jgi:transcriptional regulator with XRE-family HTH domain
MDGSVNLIVGRNLKAVRKERMVSLKDIGTHCNLTVSFLSQVETGKTLPSLTSLKAIAHYLNTTISYLMGEDGPEPDPVVRAGNRKSINYAQGITMYLLSSSDRNKQMEPLLFKMEPSASSGKSSYRHFGQEFVLVLKGMLEIRLNEQTYTLKKGDSIYFNSAIPHSFRNLDKGNTEAIWVDTPPSF